MFFDISKGQQMTAFAIPEIQLGTDFMQGRAVAQHSRQQTGWDSRSIVFTHQTARCCLSPFLQECMPRNIILQAPFRIHRTRADTVTNRPTGPRFQRPLDFALGPADSPAACQGATVERSFAAHNLCPQSLFIFAVVAAASVFGIGASATVLPDAATRAPRGCF